MGRRVKWCRECSAHDEFEDLDLDANGICFDCREHRHDRERVNENLRRLKAWAVRNGSRRPTAEMLAREVEKYDPTARGPFRWLLIWEMTGEHQMLRKVVERLCPYWKENRKRILDPAEVQQKDATT